MISIKAEPLIVERKDTLLKALIRAGMDRIPSNIILDKLLPGLGATYTEIHTQRNSIIIEPNVPVIKGKVGQQDDLMLLGIKLWGIYEGVTQLHVQKYLTDDSVPYKKLITTPESFDKIRDAVKNLKKRGIIIDIYSDYFCLFDECEKLNQDSGYRPKITNPVEDFFLFDKKAFVSATPLDIQHPKIKDFYRLVVEPNYVYKKDIELIITNDFANVLTEKLEALKDSPLVCIFYKPIAGIDSIIHSHGLAKDSKFFCSNKYTKQMIQKGYDAQSDFFLPLKKYNFFTSRYFSAFDIEHSVKPDIIILSDILQAEFSIIDPFTEAIQIQGRFRRGLDIGKNYNSLTHITNCDYKLQLQPKTPEQLDVEINEYRITHEDLYKRFNDATEPQVKEAVKKDMETSTYTKLLNKDRSLNEFAVNNLYNEERVKNYYKSPESLIKAYEDTKFFNVNYDGKPDNRFFLNQFKLDTKRGEGRKSKIMRLVFSLNKLNAGSNQNLPNGFNIKVSRNNLIGAFDDAHIIIDAYLKLGERFIYSVDYDFPKIDKALNLYMSNERLKGKEINLEIKNSFELNVKQDKNIYKQKLIEIYAPSRYNILDKVILTTIERHFEVLDNHGKPQTYELLKFKDLSANP